MNFSTFCSMLFSEFQSLKTLANFNEEYEPFQHGPFGQIYHEIGNFKYFDQNDDNIVHQDLFSSISHLRSTLPHPLATQLTRYSHLDPLSGQDDSFFTQFTANIRAILAFSVRNLAKKITTKLLSSVLPSNLLHSYDLQILHPELTMKYHCTNPYAAQSSQKYQSGAILNKKTTPKASRNEYLAIMSQFETLHSPFYRHNFVYQHSNQLEHYPTGLLNPISMGFFSISNFVENLVTKTSTKFFSFCFSHFPLTSSLIHSVIPSTPSIDITPTNLDLHPVHISSSGPPVLTLSQSLAIIPMHSLALPIPDPRKGSHQMIKEFSLHGTRLRRVRDAAYGITKLKRSFWRNQLKYLTPIIYQLQYFKYQSQILRDRTEFLLPPIPRYVINDRLKMVLVKDVLKLKKSTNFVKNSQNIGHYRSNQQNGRKNTLRLPSQREVLEDITEKWDNISINGTMKKGFGSRIQNCQANCHEDDTILQCYICGEKKNILEYLFSPKNNQTDKNLISIITSEHFPTSRTVGNVAASSMQGLPVNDQNRLLHTNGGFTIPEITPLSLLTTPFTAVIIDQKVEYVENERNFLTNLNNSTQHSPIFSSSSFSSTRQLQQFKNHYSTSHPTSNINPRQDYLRRVLFNNSLIPTPSTLYNNPVNVQIPMLIFTSLFSTDSLIDSLLQIFKYLQEYGSMNGFGRYTFKLHDIDRHKDWEVNGGMVGDQHGDNDSEEMCGKNGGNKNEPGMIKKIISSSIHDVATSLAGINNQFNLFNRGYGDDVINTKSNHGGSNSGGIFGGKSSVQNNANISPFCFNLLTILHINIYTTQYELISAKELTKTITWHFEQLGIKIPTISTMCVKRIPNNFYYQFDMTLGSK
jgi:hypothetical protein